ncbi:MAG TPA: hypothetical protein VII75_12115 [Thermoanaerobaculia bacterium]|nr:hypothetical protein [Thermoanaerobaculia bacterium]
MLLRALYATLTALFVIATASAEIPPLPEQMRVLLPVTVINAPGAFGSVWTSELRFFTPTGAPLVYPLLVAGCEPACNEPIQAIPGTVFLAGFKRTEPGETGGSWLYVEKSAVDQTVVTLTLRENSHLFTQIPTVRETEFFDDAVNIVAVPYNPDTRLTLRVYASEDFAGATVRCRVREEFPDAAVSDEIVPLSVTQRYYQTAYTFALRPAYGQLSWQPTTTTSTGRVRVEITPLTPGLRYWAFISATDNTTQQTVILTTR